MKRFLCLTAFVVLVVGAANSRAAMIMDVLGNNNPGFSDGDVVSLADIQNAQAGQPAPFDAPIGQEINGPDFSASWTHTYVLISDPIISATLQIGIHDSEGGSVGDDGVGNTVTLADEQLDFYDVDGTSVRAELIGAGFEDGGQGENNQYEEYAIVLPASLFADLADGSALISLGLKGPVASPGLLPIFPDQIQNFNGAALIFSKLTINTQPSAVIPEPSTVLLLGTGLIGILGYGWRQKRASKTEST
jgi:hypothetical protein